MLEQATSLAVHRALASACLPAPAGVDEQVIRESAERLHPPVEAGGKEWVPLLLGMLGGRVSARPSSDIDGPLVVADARERFLVFLPATERVARRGRDWFLGLAIGHVRLHWPPRGEWGRTSDVLWVPRVPRDETTRLARDEAARFAMELLLPFARFERPWRAFGPGGVAAVLGLDLAREVVEARAAEVGLR